MKLAHLDSSGFHCVNIRNFRYHSDSPSKLCGELERSNKYSKKKVPYNFGFLRNFARDLRVRHPHCHLFTAKYMYIPERKYSKVRWAYRMHNNRINVYLTSLFIFTDVLFRAFPTRCIMHLRHLRTFRRHWDNHHPHLPYFKNNLKKSSSVRFDIKTHQACIYNISIINYQICTD